MEIIEYLTSLSHVALEFGVEHRYILQIIQVKLMFFAENTKTIFITP